MRVVQRIPWRQVSIPTCLRRRAKRLNPLQKSGPAETMQRTDPVALQRGEAPYRLCTVAAANCETACPESEW